MVLPVPEPKDGWVGKSLMSFPPWVKSNLEVIWAVALLNLGVTGGILLVLVWILLF